MCVAVGGCKNHGRALETPNLIQDEHEYPKGFSEAVSKPGPAPKQPYGVGSCKLV